MQKKESRKNKQVAYSKFGDDFKKSCKMKNFKYFSKNTVQKSNNEIHTYTYLQNKNNLFLLQTKIKILKTLSETSMHKVNIQKVKLKLSTRIDFPNVR